MKSLRSSVILLLLIFCGGAYIYWNEREIAPRDGAVVLLRATTVEVKLVEFSPSKLKLQRAGETWQVRDESGRKARADADLVKDLFDALQLVQSNAPVENPEKLSAYGLEKPRAQIIVDGKTLEFGDSPAFDARRVYARSDIGIALVETSLFDWSQKSFEAWRDNAISRFETENVSRIALQSPQLNAVFTKNEANPTTVEESWTIEKPLRARADASVISEFLGALQAAKTTRWLDESGANSKKWGLDKPRATLSLGGENLNLKLEIGAAHQGGFAARTSASRAVFLLPSAIYDLLNRPLQKWRDSKIVVFNANAVSKIEVATRGSRRILLKNGDDWQLENKARDSKARGAALDLLDFLGTLRAEDFVDSTKNEAATIKARFGFDKPVLHLKVEAEGGEILADVRLGRAGGKLYAQNLSSALARGEAGTIFVLDDEALVSIQSALDKIFQFEAPK